MMGQRESIPAIAAAFGEKIIPRGSPSEISTFVKRHPFLLCYDSAYACAYGFVQWKDFYAVVEELAFLGFEFGPTDERTFRKARSFGGQQTVNALNLGLTRRRNAIHQKLLEVDVPRVLVHLTLEYLVLCVTQTTLFKIQKSRQK
jgi:hypothetical protein